jgi:hypothetical protein
MDFIKIYNNDISENKNTNVTTNTENPPINNDIYNNSVKRINQMKKIQTTALELFTRKNKDYGDAFAEFGTIGVLMRIEDKLKRIMSITNNKIILVNDETLKDTLLDLHNYSAMALMLMDDDEDYDIHT